MWIFAFLRYRNEQSIMELDTGIQGMQMHTFNQKKFSDMVKRQIIGDRTLKEAAQAAGVHASTLCRIRQGKLPSLDVLGMFAEQMGVSVDIFFGGD